ncbi:MAG: glycosyltransferase [Sedimentisphaerales bacterium]|nr:glycosyltransferase [Sedimentisphaerales bacterium]
MPALFVEEMMRIAFIINGFPTLSETFILEQIIGLLDRGHEVFIFAKRISPQPTTHFSISQYHLMQRVRYHTTVPKNKTARRFKALYYLIKSFFQTPLRTFHCFKYLSSDFEFRTYPFFFTCLPMVCKRIDIAHCHFGPNGNLGIALKQMGGAKRVVTTFHGYDANCYPAETSPDVYMKLFHAGDAFTANTEFTKQRMVELGCDASKIQILPVGLNMTEFHYHEPSMEPNQPVRILTVARLVEKKGHLFALQALSNVIHKYPHFEYILVGEGPLENEIKQTANKLGLRSHVIFRGGLSREQVLEEYTKAHIFLLPSITAKNGDKEGQGLVLQEAQAMGLPVITTNHNGIPEGVLEGQSAFLVNEWDTEALTDKLGYLIENPQQWKPMGRAGRNYVEKKYDINTLNDRLVEMYKDLLS